MTTYGPPTTRKLSGFSDRFTPCPDCRGTGKVLEPRNIAGEAIDADLVEVACDYCGSEGELPASCVWCERIEPLDDEGYCCACVEPVFVPDETTKLMMRLRDGAARDGFASEPDEQLTEVHSDPFRRVA